MKQKDDEVYIGKDVYFKPDSALPDNPIIMVWWMLPMAMPS